MFVRERESVCVCSRVCGCVCKLEIASVFGMLCTRERECLFLKERVCVCMRSANSKKW